MGTLSVRDFYTNNSELLFQMAFPNFFNRKDDSYNIPACDNKECAVCGKIPPIKIIERIGKNGKLIIEKDRSSRMDTEENDVLYTFHTECYTKVLQARKLTNSTA